MVCGLGQKIISIKVCIDSMGNPLLEERLYLIRIIIDIEVLDRVLHRVSLINRKTMDILTYRRTQHIQSPNPWK